MSGADFELTAGWGHFGSGQAVMPGQGRVTQRPYTPAERQSLLDVTYVPGLYPSTPSPLEGGDRDENVSASHVAASTPSPLEGEGWGEGYPSPSRVGVEVEDAVSTLGATTLDIHLNDRACWRNVPAAVWDYKLGGYQVLKKWLSYRERSVLDRPLTPDEIHHFTATARRIATILLLTTQSAAP